MKLKLSFLNVFAIILFLYFAFIAIKDPDEEGWIFLTLIITFFISLSLIFLDFIIENFVKNSILIFIVQIILILITVYFFRNELLYN